MQTWTYSQPTPRLLLWPVRSPVDAVAYVIELAELFDVEVDQLARLLALMSAGWLGRLQGAQLAQPKRFRTRLTVEAETPTVTAIS